MSESRELKLSSVRCGHMPSKKKTGERERDVEEKLQENIHTMVHRPLCFEYKVNMYFSIS